MGNGSIGQGPTDNRPATEQPEEDEWAQYRKVSLYKHHRDKAIQLRRDIEPGTYQQGMVNPISLFPHFNSEGNSLVATDYSKPMADGKRMLRGLDLVHPCAGGSQPNMVVQEGNTTILKCKETKTLSGMDEYFADKFPKGFVLTAFPLKEKGGNPMAVSMTGDGPRPAITASGKGQGRGRGVHPKKGQPKKDHHKGHGKGHGKGVGQGKAKAMPKGKGKTKANPNHGLPLGDRITYPSHRVSYQVPDRNIRAVDSDDDTIVEPQEDSDLREARRGGPGNGRFPPYRGSQAYQGSQSNQAIGPSGSASASYDVSRHQLPKGSTMDTSRAWRRNGDRINWEHTNAIKGLKKDIADLYDRDYPDQEAIDAKEAELAAKEAELDAFLDNGVDTTKNGSKDAFARRPSLAPTPRPTPDVRPETERDMTDAEVPPEVNHNGDMDWSSMGIN